MASKSVGRSAFKPLPTEATSMSECPSARRFIIRSFRIFGSSSTSRIRAMQSPPFRMWPWSVLPLHEGKCQDKQDTLFFVPLEHQISPVLLGDAPRDSKAQSCSSGFGRKERLEDLWDGIRRDRRTLILN